MRQATDHVPSPHRGRRLGALLVVLGAAVTLPAAVSTPAPTAAAVSSATSVTVTADGLRVEPTPTLPDAVPGSVAVRALGDRLDDAARLNGVGEQRFRDLLAEQGAWLDEQARLYYVDPQPTAATTAADEPRVAEGPYPADQTFLLHSKPGSLRTIFLDVDGHTVADSAWNDPELPNGDHPAWDPGRNGAAFSSAELDLVQSLWQRVAEDFAPFDVDVTTQDPGTAALVRTDRTDQRYGTRALISPSTSAHQAICGGQCGGVAYVGTFDAAGAGERYQPAWVFPQALGPDSVKLVAEATSHEVGHNLGLDHDGKDGSGYYGGHAAWGPIMGAAYGVPVSQWSRGDYAGATQRQDDVSIIAGRTQGLRADEAGGTVATAAPWPSSGTVSGFVTARDDVDVHDLGSCSGPTTVRAAVAPTSPNLDLRLRLLDAAGTAVATADPPSGRQSSDVATGLGATLTLDLPAGRYLVEVDGVGNGEPSTGYDDYGSLGGYTLTRTGCSTTVATRGPSAPRSLVATAAADGRSARLTWEAPADAGSGVVTGYTVSRSGSASTTTTGTTATLSGLEPGTTTTVTVRVTSSSGNGEAATAVVTTPTAPAAPSDLTGRLDAGTGTLAWTAPADPAGSPVTGYEVAADDGAWVALPASARRHAFAGLGGDRHDLAVRAVNAVGTGPVARTSVQVGAPEPTAPGAVTALTQRRTGTSAVVTWAPPLDDGGREVTGYDVQVGGTTVRVTATGVTISGLRRGTTHAVTVRAVNAVGAGPSTGTTIAVPTTPGAPRIGVAASGRAGRPVTAVARWLPPSATGGAAVTGYQVLAQPVDARGRARSAARLLAVPLPTLARRTGVQVELRLPAGRYRFAVRARNEAGWGATSARSGVVVAR